MNLISLLKKQQLAPSYILHCSDDFFHHFYESFTQILSMLYSKKSLLEIHYNEKNLSFNFAPQFSPYEFFFYSEASSKNFYEKLLKTLEEPPYPLVFFFKYENFLPMTIESRSLSLFFQENSLNDSFLEKYRLLGTQIIEKNIFHPHKYLEGLKKYVQEKPYHLTHLNLQLELFQLEKDYETCSSKISRTRS